MLRKPINIAIVHGHTIFRKALKDYLSQQSGVQITIQSADITDLLSKLKSVYVHVVIMDIFLPQVNSLEAVKMIRDTHPDIKIIILSMHTNMSLLSELMEAGVYGILSRGDEPDELTHAIVSAAEGRIYQSKLLTEVLYWNKQSSLSRYNESYPVLLNERERLLIQMLWEEKTNKEIAEQLFLSIRSVEKIRQDLKEKINVKSTVGLFKYALQNKIIRIAIPSFS